jgi:hypothetical protein
MYEDIEVAINGNANYLAALGLSTYTENLGGLFQGDLENNLGRNYAKFIKCYFPKPEYDKVNSVLSHRGGLYKVVRCGLVHEYFMKIQGTVELHSKTSDKCGIIYDKLQTPPLRFIVSKYFDDFKFAFDKYYYELLVASSSNRNNLEKRFDNAIFRMPFDPFEKSDPTKLSTASGGHSSTIYFSSNNQSTQSNHP